VATPAPAQHLAFVCTDTCEEDIESVREREARTGQGKGGPAATGHGHNAVLAQRRDLSLSDQTAQGHDGRRTHLLGADSVIPRAQTELAVAVLPPRERATILCSQHTKHTTDEPRTNQNEFRTGESNAVPAATGH
jgi:hypothetical protein